MPADKERQSCSGERSHCIRMRRGAFAALRRTENGVAKWSSLPPGHATGATTPLAAEHAENLHRLDMMLPGFGSALDAAGMDGRVSFRPMSPDRLPIVGPLAGSDGLWICDGFGARGLVFAPICAELLASRIDGAPLPLEDDLVQAIAPARFRQSKRRRDRSDM